MIGNFIKLCLMITGVAGVAGCAAVPREAGFPDVEKTVADRTGGKRVHWNQGTASDAAVHESVRTLLSNELSADEAVQVALLNNRNLQATYEDLMVAQADLVEAGLLSNPVFDGELRFAEGGGGTGIEVSLAQDFLEILYIPLRRRLAAAEFEATKLRVAGEVLDLAGEVRGAYYDLEASRQMLELRQQILTATEASYDLARRLREAGNITELDLANERVLYEQSKINLAAAEAQVVQDREMLNELLGLWGNQTAWSTPMRLPELPSPAREAMAENLERRAIERSLDLAALRRQIEIAGRRLGITRPFGGLGFVEAGLSAEREPGGEWSLGPSVSLPIPLFNQGQPAVAKALAELRRAQHIFTATAVAVRARVRAAYSDVIAARERTAYYREVILPLRQKIVQHTQLQYNAMQVGTFQLLQAKQQQIEAANEYIESLHEYWLARTDLDQILSGRLSSGERSEPREMRSAVPVVSGGGATGLGGSQEE